MNQGLSIFLALTLDIVQLRSFLLQLRLQRLRLRFEVSQSLVQRYLLCRHFRGWRGSHIFPLSRKRSAAKRLRAELTADAAVMTSEGEDAPPVSRGGGSCIPVMLPHIHTQDASPKQHYTQLNNAFFFTLPTWREGTSSFAWKALMWQRERERGLSGILICWNGAKMFSF